MAWGVKLPLRPDGRAATELRTIEIETDLLQSAKGSARVSFAGTTSVVAAVFGPRSTGNSTGGRRLQIIVRRAEGVINRGSFERFCELTIHDILSSILRLDDNLRGAFIQVILQVETSNGGLLSCAINAAMAAILSAGIPCRDTVVAVPIGIGRKKNTNSSVIIADPTQEDRLDDIEAYCLAISRKSAQSLFYFGFELSSSDHGIKSACAHHRVTCASQVLEAAQCAALPLWSALEQCQSNFARALEAQLVNSSSSEEGEIRSQ